MVVFTFIDGDWWLMDDEFLTCGSLLEMFVEFLKNYFLAIFIVKNLTNFFFGQNCDQISNDRYML